MVSYFSDRMFQLKLRDARSSRFSCRVGVSQGSVLGPVLYNIFTIDLAQVLNTFVATYADGVAFLACNRDPNKAYIMLQLQLNTTNE